MKTVQYTNSSGATVTGVRGDFGRKFLPVILMDSAGIKVTKLPKSEWRYVHDLDLYPIGRALQKFRLAGRKFGSTREARKMLRGRKR